jgi:hypothetical protein
MNGRLYDPILGRMLSPDNNVQMPDFSQNLNRYSYVLNNPLSYTDPDGEWIHLVIGALIGGTINVLTNFDNIDNFGQGLAYFGIGAAAGALGAGVGMGVTATLTGGAATFGGGFVGAELTMNAISASYTTSFLGGAMIGRFSGFSTGFINGTGNSLMQGDNFGESLGNGFRQGAISGLQGALTSGLLQGLDATMDGRTFIDGSLKKDNFGNIIPSKHDLLGQIEYEVESFKRDIIPELEHDFVNDYSNFDLKGYNVNELDPTQTILSMTKSADVTMQFSYNFRQFEGSNVISTKLNLVSTTFKYSYTNRFNNLWGWFYKW